MGNGRRSGPLHGRRRGRDRAARRDPHPDAARINAVEIAAKAEKRDVKDGEIQPACVQSCSARALVFGDLNDPESDVSRLSKSPRGAKLLEELGTKPVVTYLSRQTQA